MIQKLLLISITLFFVGCSSTSDPRYKVKSVGNYSRSVEAEVLASQPVIIVNPTTGAGANIGGLAGATAAANNSDNIGVVLIGLVGGAIIGEMVESDLRESNGTQYTIQTNNGAIISIAQPNVNNEIFKPGDKVILVYGHPHRLIRDPRE